MKLLSAKLAYFNSLIYKDRIKAKNHRHYLKQTKKDLKSLHKSVNNAIKVGKTHLRISHSCYLTYTKEALQTFKQDLVDNGYILNDIGNSFTVRWDLKIEKPK